MTVTTKRKRARPVAAPLDEDGEIEELERRCAAEAPPPGSQPSAPFPLFEEMPLSSRTKAGLQAGGFTAPTAIQAACIPHALVGRDVLGAARTGSGKTLAFLVVVLERLHRERWSTGDGLGALIVTPTRELALQIFEVLRKVGARHALSAALLTGGKRDFVEEQSRVARMALVVATPGRLLQHLEQTPDFEAGTLRSLVLDEADRLLDLGFARELDAIMTYLPRAPQRQTLLFSATQTRSVRALARLSLAKEGTEYLAVHEVRARATHAVRPCSPFPCASVDHANRGARAYAARHARHAERAQAVVLRRAARQRLHLANLLQVTSDSYIITVTSYELRVTS